jgi:hypothetical protein
MPVAARDPVRRYFTIGAAVDYLLLKTNFQSEVRGSFDQQKGKCGIIVN